MRRLHRSMPSPAMAVACLALLVALGGTSWAAATLVLPRNSVGERQLRNNAVVSSKVRDGSLLARDFRPGQLLRGPRGLQGPSGLVGPAGPAGAQGPAGTSAALAPGYVAGVQTATGASPETTTTTTFAALANSTVNVTVPTGETAQLVLMFSAESACYGGTGAQRCSVRLVVDGSEANPAVGDDFGFDNNDAGGATVDSLQGHALVRVSNPLNAGSHTVQVQVRSSSASTNFRIDDWELVVQRVRLS